MDWNRTNTILLIAFIVLNIFLLIATFSNIFTENLNVNLDKDFLENVESLLKDKNINIKCDIPEEIYVLPVLETEYKMVEVDNLLVQKYLGEGVEAIEDVYTYKNGKNEILEIKDGKKINFKKRSLNVGKIKDDEVINKSIKEFIKEYDLDDTGLAESYRYISEGGSYVTYTQNYNGISIDNSYMEFFCDKDGVYGFEMQKINSVEEIKDKIRTISAAESLTRLMSYDDIKDKDIVEIKIKYYSMETENWKHIAKINADPTWKIIFSDGSQKYLLSSDLN